MFDRGNTFPVTPGAVVYLCEFGVHRVSISKKLKKFKGTGRLRDPEQEPRRPRT